MEVNATKRKCDSLKKELEKMSRAAAGRYGYEIRVRPLQTHTYIRYIYCTGPHLGLQASRQELKKANHYNEELKSQIEEARQEKTAFKAAMEHALITTAIPPSKSKTIKSQVISLLICMSSSASFCLSRKLDQC